MPQVTAPSKDTLDKLAEGYRYVKIPTHDPYEQKFDGIWINSTHYKPGQHLVSAEVADELEAILDRWQRSMFRLLRPTPNREAVRDAVGKGSASSKAEFDEAVAAE